MYGTVRCLRVIADDGLMDSTSRAGFRDISAGSMEVMVGSMSYLLARNEAYFPGHYINGYMDI